MGLSIAVWNVEHFKARSQRVRVGQLIRSHDPDVFGILEFLDKRVGLIQVKF